MNTLCKRCLFDYSIPDVIINENGICNYCERHVKLEKEYPNDEVGHEKLQSLFKTIKKSGEGKQYDCVIGISGGCDSSFLLDIACKNGLRPLVLHFDNGWDTEIAINNMNCVCDALNLKIHTYKVDPDEFNDIVRSFMLAGVPDIDAASDIGMITAMYRYAEKYGIEYIVEGHSFRTEGIQPISWAYVDGKYIESVHKLYGKIKLNSFPNLWYDDFKRWVTECKIKRVRPLYYYLYVKSDVKKYLELHYGWKDYCGHHLENDFTAFNYTYYLPVRLKVDERINEYSALIRSGQMNKAEAIKLLQQKLLYSEELLSRVKQKLLFDDMEFNKIMSQPIKTFRDFETYKKRFENEVEFWRKMYEDGIVPKSFFLKYCLNSFD